MTEPLTPTEPLIGARSDTSINVGAPQASGGRSTRAYKVAGLTLLGCVLIMGQAMIVYFLYSQKSDINSLQEQSHKLNTEMTNQRSVSVPKRMQIPMDVMPKLSDVSMDEEASTGSPEKSDPEPSTTCQLEASGLAPVPVPGFRPKCDERGRYRAEQCFMGSCWCVNPDNGQEIPGTLVNGRAQCMASLFTGGMSLALSDAEEQ
ncbi:insulin-like growth factor-binding protein 2 isoform X2 [Betta splendens]|uniref:Insulin-like growth factor-binding protein 2 isoform X2 n=1 Tax=Betta splendens TaxID=158456 RepID=A0A6P7PFR4_BETSP|nr:insulin-like growth factor-binding protein 2 isoform X2 [Betta splendens]